jgi:hypothetical protein
MIKVVRIQADGNHSVPMTTAIHPLLLPNNENAQPRFLHMDLARMFLYHFLRILPPLFHEVSCNPANKMEKIITIKVICKNLV